jgi:hypothetical protein
MKRRILFLGLVVILLLVASAVVLAQDAPPPAAAPAAPAAAPAKPSAPVTPASPLATAAEIARVLDPELLKLLRENYGPHPRTDSGVTGPDKLAILSAPEGCEVYLAAVSEIREAKTSAGGEPAVEDVVFTDEHYIGEAPVTVALPAGDYVLAMRAYGKLNGFDGGCVRKSTTDVITGGVRHSYHLYPIRKREGEYQLFVANFAVDSADQATPIKRAKAPGIFTFEPALIIAELAASTNVPQAEQDGIAQRLNKDGLAFYGSSDARYLVKLTLLGAKFHIEEWPVE